MGIFKQTAKAQQQGEGFPIPTAGTHPAVLAAIVDLGTHEDADRKTGRKYEKRRVYFCWEVEDADAAGGPRFFVATDYTLSFGERAKLRALVENWSGKKFSEGEEFDISKLLGKPCFLQIVHKTASTGREVAQIVGASKLPKGVQAIKPTHGPFSLDLSEGGTAADLPEWLPYLYGRPVSEHIGESKEVSGGGEAAAVGADAASQAMADELGF